jgi:hypothetical protein
MRSICIIFKKNIDYYKLEPKWYMDEPHATQFTKHTMPYICDELHMPPNGIHFD